MIHMCYGFYCDDVALNNTLKVGGIRTGFKLSLHLSIFKAHHFVCALLIFMNIIILYYINIY